MRNRQTTSRSCSLSATDPPEPPPYHCFYAPQWVSDEPGTGVALKRGGRDEGPGDRSRQVNRSGCSVQDPRRGRAGRDPGRAGRGHGGGTRAGSRVWITVPAFARPGATSSTPTETGMRLVRSFASILAAATRPALPLAFLALGFAPAGAGPAEPPGHGLGLRYRD